MSDESHLRKRLGLGIVTLVVLDVLSVLIALKVGGGVPWVSNAFTLGAVSPPWVVRPNCCFPSIETSHLDYKPLIT